MMSVIDNVTTTAADELLLQAARICMSMHALFSRIHTGLNARNAEQHLSLAT